MQQLPKIVLERLQARLRSDHPDPDVLTAFAEQSLPGPERAVVMEHLARCGECREVLALALPELEEENAAAAAPVRRPLLSMPVLRWGAIAAVLVVLASVAFLRHRLHSPEISTMMTAAMRRPEQAIAGTVAGTVKKPQAPMGEAQTQALLVTPIIPPADHASRVPARSVQKQAARNIATSADALKARETLSIPGELPAVPAPRSRSWLAPARANAFKPAPNALGSESSVANGAPASSPSPSPASRQTVTVEVSGASPQLMTESTTLNSNQVSTQSQTQQSSTRQAQAQPSQLPQPSIPSFGNQAASAGAVVGKAKAPVTAQAVGTVVNGRNLSALPTAPAAPPAPRWAITSAGGLQRSYDRGQTWQDVYVFADPALATTAMQVESAPHAAKKSAKANAAQLLIPSPVFRAISAAGLEVWAGGVGGLLYHSLDAGDHWTSAIPSQPGVFLTGDIVSVEFTDAFNGKVATSTAEIWTTADRGQHWSKQ